jgi:hypothetical protein
MRCECCLTHIKPGQELTCECCSETCCKKCQTILREDTFSYSSQVAPELKHTRYCARCMDSVIEPALEAYREQLANAKNAYFFTPAFKKRIPVLKKAKSRVQIKGTPDRDETILRLAFLAIEQGHNAVIEAEVSAQKVRNEGYQKSLWVGSGLPVTIDLTKFEREQAYDDQF